MLIIEPTEEMLHGWMETWKEYKDKIKPNRRSGEEIIDYIKSKYVLLPVTEFYGQNISDEVSNVIKGNDYLYWRLPVGKKTDIKSFIVENKGEGKKLYEAQDDIFKGLEILISVDLVTGYAHIENSSLLADEITAFQGVDEIDITNYFLVAEYVKCRKKFGMEI